jgi:ATP-dependent RNA helicase SUPV3L1/SUV3
MRQSLRAKQVRLGPVLVFLPALNKPAAVRLRGLLWALWNDRSLPVANMPADGVVSFRVDAATADRRFYQAIGYPVYGPRAIRIDMLDRVISAVYDNAKDGKFRAEHKMAEWLGSSIDDLYEVLMSMGHRKIQAAPPVSAPPVEASSEATEPVADEPKPEDTKPVDAKPADVKQADVKPELAQFWLKKGKAFEKKKPFEASKPREQKKPSSDKTDRPKFRKDKGPRRDQHTTIMSASVQSKPEDSPFAILSQLKAKKDVAAS